MKIQNLKTKVIGPILLLIPMACMHLGDGHHSGGHHSLAPHTSFQSSPHGLAPDGMTGAKEMAIPQDVKDTE